MKKVVAGVLATALLSGTLMASSAAKPNLLVNGNFENGMTNWTPMHIGNAASENQFGSTGGKAEVVSGGHSGKALKITQGNREDGSLAYFGRAEQNLISKEKPKVGDAYMFTAWVKAESIPADVKNPKVQMILDLAASQGEKDKDGKPLDHHQMEVLASQELTTEWKKITGVSRLMSFEQQDGPKTVYKGIIGFHSSPIYAGANNGFDEGIKADAPMTMFSPYIILSGGPSKPVPLMIDDMELKKPIYNFIFDKATADSKVLYKESGTECYIHEGTNVAVYREAKDDAYFIYKFDFDKATKDAIVSMSLGDDYKVEVATNPNGPWTKVASGKAMLQANAYKADEIIDVTGYLNKNDENSVYFKFSDQTKGDKGTKKNGVTIRALEVFSETGALEFKLPPTGNTSSTDTKPPTGNTSTGGSSSTGTKPPTGNTSDAASDVTSDKNSTTESDENTTSEGGSATESGEDTTGDESTDNSTPTSDQEEEKGGSLLWLWITLGVIVVLGGGGAALYFLVIQKKLKK